MRKKLTALALALALCLGLAVPAMAAETETRDLGDGHAVTVSSDGTISFTGSEFSADDLIEGLKWGIDDISYFHWGDGIMDVEGEYHTNITVDISGSDITTVLSINGKDETISFTGTGELTLDLLEMADVGIDYSYWGGRGKAESLTVNIGSGITCPEEVRTVLEAAAQRPKDSSFPIYVHFDGAAPSIPAAPAQIGSLSVNPNSSTVLVNGENVAFDAYTIEGSNYFKLRDLAFVLNGTEKQFEVGWDNTSKTITLTSGSAYTANGSEMAAKGAGSKAAAVSASKLLIDGKEVSLTAYTIGGNNYFKLRDIGQAFDFGIGWDNTTKTITIDTSTGYTA